MTLAGSRSSATIASSAASASAMRFSSPGQELVEPPAVRVGHDGRRHQVRSLRFW